MALHQRVGVEAMQEGGDRKERGGGEKGALWCYPWPSILWVSMSSRGQT